MLWEGGKLLPCSVTVPFSVFQTQLPNMLTLSLEGIGVADPASLTFAF